MSVFIVIILIIALGFGLKHYFWSKKYKNKLQLIKLNNQIDVLLVHNNDFKNATINLQIKAGLSYNPADIPGLATVAKNLLVEGLNTSKARGCPYTFPGNTSFTVFDSINLKTINIEMQTKNDNLKMAASILSWSILNIPVDKNTIENAISLQEEFFEKSNKIPSEIYEEFYRAIIDEAFPERRFFSGNKETLSRPDIEERVKEFISTNFISGNLKLVICSKEPFEKLKEVAKIFEQIVPVVPEKTIQNIKPLNLCFPEYFAGKIVKYSSFEETPTLNIVIRCPSLSNTLRYCLAEYLNVIICGDDGNSICCKLFGLFTDICMHHEIIQNFDLIEIKIVLTSIGIEKIDQILQTFHTFLSSQIPLLKIFKKAKLLKSNISEPDSLSEEPNAGIYFSKLLSKYPCDTPREKGIECEYNENAVRDFFNMIIDVKNWVVLVSTPETELPNQLKYTLQRYSDPVPINLAVNFASDLKMRIKLQKEFVQNFENNQKINISTLPLVCSQYLSHQEFENGEYTAYMDLCFRSKCAVDIVFHTNMTPDQALDSMVFFQAFFTHINYFLTNYQLASFHFECFTLYPVQKILFLGDRHLAIFFLNQVFLELKAFKPTEKEIQKAKEELKKYFENSYAEISPLGFLKIAFLSYLKNYPTDFTDFNKRIDSAGSSNMPYWYTEINSFGILSSLELNAIYEIAKSSGTKSLLASYGKPGTRYTFKTSDILNKTYMIAYKISDLPKMDVNPILWQSALGCILYTILRTPFQSHVRSDYPISYLQNVNAEVFNDSMYIVFQVQSTESIEEIEKALLSFPEKIESIIQSISKEDLERIKKNACKPFNKSLDVLENKMKIFDSVKAIKVFDLNIEEALKKVIMSITLEDLVNTKTFKVEPIIIHSEHSSTDNE